jgi:DNA-binding response OmpR family regulator
MWKTFFKAKASMVWLRWLSEHTPDIAVVDPHLRDGMCIEVIQVLTDRKVPFVVHSGERPEDAEEEHRFHKGHWVAKPYGPRRWSLRLRPCLQSRITANPILENIGG